MTPEKSKYHYIKIDSISEIDPLKLSISQIQQRYIDKDNNRYALRFNKETRRIEILKLIGNHFEVVPKAQVHSAMEEPKTTQNPTTPQISQQITQVSEDLKSNPILGKLVGVLGQKPTDKPVEIPKEKQSPIGEENLMSEDVDLDIFEGEEPLLSPKNHSPMRDFSIHLSHQVLRNTKLLKTQNQTYKWGPILKKKLPTKV